MADEAPVVIWESWRRWERAEVLAGADELGRMQRELVSAGAALTRHYNPVEEVTALVAWRWGASDYAALSSESDFFGENPQERWLAEHFRARGCRVEFGAAQLESSLRERAGSEEPSVELKCRVRDLIEQLRVRCGLGRGLLVQLDAYVLERMAHLTLFDRRLRLAGELSAGPGGQRRLPPELVAFDRRLEELGRGLRSL